MKGLLYTPPAPQFLQNTGDLFVPSERAEGGNQQGYLHSLIHNQHLSVSRYKVCYQFQGKEEKNDQNLKDAKYRKVKIFGMGCLSASVG